jgi:hypothetical protein
MGGDNKSPAHGQIEKTESKLPKLSLSGWAILHSGYARCAGSMDAVARLVGIEGGVVSGVFHLESSGVRASDWRPRHDKRYHEA